MAKLRNVFIGVLILLSLYSQSVSAENYNKDNSEVSPSVELKSNGGLFKPNNRGKGLEGRIIVIDPGHGGSDPGAMGLTNTREKDFTLAIGLELRRLLENSKVKVIMTRETDKDVYGMFATDTTELQSRVNIANDANADLFISVHIDSFVNGLANGTANYYYSKTEQDEQLARFVQESMVGQLKLLNRGYQEKGFYVLKNTNMPAILTEVAFISNPEEEKMLKNSTFIKKAATGIYNGIAKYFSY